MMLAVVVCCMLAADVFFTAKGVPSCPEVKCSSECEFGFLKDSNNCQTCSCFDPCKEKKCPPYHTCKAKYINCYDEVCPLETICTPKECPKAKCKFNCSSGYRKDENGCPTCWCEDHCEQCKEDEICRKHPNCFIEPCNPIDNCLKNCTARNCTNECLSGFRLDKNGCETCQCIDPCEDADCPKGKECQRGGNICDGGLCYDTRACVEKKCQESICTKKCESGYRVDEKGCETCQCQNPCEDANCTEREVCKILVKTCDREPCYQSHECVPIEGPQPLRARECSSGYGVDEKNCGTCQCVDPCEKSPCKEYEVCKKKERTCDSKPCCPTHECVTSCPTLPECTEKCSSGYVDDSNGCPTCQCVTTCEQMKCKSNERCFIVVSECLEPPCDPEPICKPV